MSTASQPNPIVPLDEAKRLILDAIMAADGPVTAASLAKLSAKRVSGKQVDQLLAEDVAAGRIFKWGNPGYWDRERATVVRERLLGLVAREFLPRAQVKKRVAQGIPKVGLRVVQAILEDPEMKERLKEASIPKSRTKGIFDAQHPELYLRLVLKSLGIERQVRTFPSDDDSQPAPQTSAPADLHEVADRIFAAMNRIAFAPGTTVTFYRLRQQPELADIPKKIFDEAALLLQQERRALLAVHDHAAGLPVEEQVRFVTDGLGKFYVSIYAR